MKRFLLAILFVLAAVPAVDAHGYRNGSWYQFHGGYWYQYNNGYWSQPHLYSQGAYVLYTAPRYAADWKAKLVDAAKLQDDHRAYLEALGALGYTQQSSASASAYADGTGYQYSTASIAELYGRTDVNTLFNQAARLAESAQELGASATAGHLSAVKEVGSASARVAEILARGNVAAEILRSTEPQASARVETFRSEGGIARALVAPSSLIAVHCAACHSPNEKNKTGFDVTNITPEWANAAIDQVSDRAMPRNNKALPSATRFEIIAELRQFAKKENHVPKKEEE